MRALKSSKIGLLDSPMPPEYANSK